MARDLGRLETEVELGYVSGVFGVRGEVRLHLHHRESQLLHAGGDAVLINKDGERRPVTLSTRAGAGRRVLGRIGGITSRDQAASLHGHRVVVDRTALPALEPDEFYFGDVEGLDVYCDEVRVGTVIRVHDGGGAEVLEIRVDQGTEYVPCVRELVVDVDVPNGRVNLHPDALD